MKKKTDIMQQMKNSQQFLSKLNGFKKASKQIRDKNKLVSHRNIWVKQFKYLSRLQRDSQLDIRNYLDQFDRYFDHEIEDRQIFGKQNYKNYTTYFEEINQGVELFDHQVWQQLRSLPLLLSKTKQMKNKQKNNIDIKDVATIVYDIGSFLQDMKSKNADLYEKLQEEQLTLDQIMGVDEDVEQGTQGDFTMLKSLLGKVNYDDVKGFDFERDQIRRIQIGENHLRDYLQSLSDRLSQDQILQVISEYQHATNLLNQTLQLQIQKINLDYEQILNLDTEVLSMSQNYQKMHHIYNTYMGRGKSVALYTERLSIEFPKINRKILERVTEYIQGKIYKQRKINAIKRNYLREKQQLLQKVEKQVNQRIQNKIKKAQKQAQNLQRRQDKLKLQQQLQILRKQYNQRQSEKQKVLKEQEEKKKKQQRKKQAIRKLYLDELNKKATEIIEVKEKKAKDQQIEKEKLKEIQENQRKKNIMNNKPKVKQRQSVEIKKIEKKFEEMQERKEIPVKNQERINKAIEKYSFRPEIQASQERLNAPTQALVKRKQTKFDKADKIELSKATGYNMKQLMGDMRFKLNTALQQAGLANTQYAHQVLLGMSKRPNP